MTNLAINWVEAFEADPWDNDGRVCTKCGEWKPWGEFYVNCTAKSKHMARCKSCKKDGFEPRPDYKIDTYGRVCTVCGEWKSWDPYSILKSSSTGYAPSCKNCRAQLQMENRNVKYERQWYAENREHVLKKTKQWREDNIEYAREYGKNYYWKNRGRELVETKEYMSSAAKFETHAQHLTVLESPKEGENGELLVKCSTCRDYFIPTNRMVNHRRMSLEGKADGEKRLYCSDECKEACSVFGRVNYQANHPALQNKRYDPQQVREIAFAQYGETCEKCGKVHGRENLKVHPELSFKQFPMYEADEKNLWVLYDECHKQMHTLPGCSYSEIAQSVCY